MSRIDQEPEVLLRDLRDPDRWVGLRTPRPVPASAAQVQPRATRAALVAGFVIAILAVGAIAWGFGSLHRAAAPAQTSTPSATPTTTASASATPAAVFTVVPGRQRSYSSTSEPPACPIAQLATESKQDGGGAGGTYYQQVFLRNTGGDCWLATDAVEVGGTVAKLSMGEGKAGLVLPEGATATLRVAAASACQPSGVKSNVSVDQAAAHLPIVLRTDGGERTMTARFPQWHCSGPFVDADLDPAAAQHVASPLAALTVQIDTGTWPAIVPAGVRSYTATVTDTSSMALVLGSCPAVTEVLTDASGDTAIRDLHLRCAPGMKMEPGASIVLSMTTTVPKRGAWDVDWFWRSGTTTTATSTTCTLDQLRFSEAKPGGGEVGDFWQLVSVRNTGDACTLPASAFLAGGRTAVAGDSQALRVAAGATERVIVGAAQECADGSSNTSTVDPSAPADKPLVVTLGGRQVALQYPFPQLRCSAPFVDRS